MDDLDLQNVKTKYTERDDIWIKKDKWHYYSYKTIEAFINKNVKKLKISNDIDIINLGSGGTVQNFV